jgi:uncharacterized membrane protein YeiH
VVGTLDTGFQKPPPDDDSVSPLSLFTITTLTVSGTLKGDMMQIDVDDVNIASSGSVTASGGGYISDRGLGKTISLLRLHNLHFRPTV